MELQETFRASGQGRGKKIARNQMKRLTNGRFEIKFCSLVLKAPKWRNWQTRYVQGVVGLRSCGFKSHLRHTPRRKTGFSFPTRLRLVLNVRLG